MPNFKFQTPNKHQSSNLKTSNGDHKGLCMIDFREGALRLNATGVTSPARRRHRFAFFAFPLIRAEIVSVRANQTERE
jgi:hypothetical protein